MALRERNTVKMVADHWGCSPEHVYNMIAAGTLPALKLGGLIRITREQVEACEAACNTKTKLDQEKVRVDAIRRERDFQAALKTAKRQQINGARRGKT